MFFTSHILLILSLLVYRKSILLNSKWETIQNTRHAYDLLIVESYQPKQLCLEMVLLTDRNFNSKTVIMKKMMLIVMIMTVTNVCSSEPLRDAQLLTFTTTLREILLSTSFYRSENRSKLPKVTRVKGRNSTWIQAIWPQSSCFFFFFNKFLLFLFIFGCVGSLLPCVGFSLRWLLLVQSTGSRAQAQWLWPTGLVVPRHVRSSQTRAGTRVPCIGRRILNHCATREAPRAHAFNTAPHSLSSVMRWGMLQCFRNQKVLQ